MRKRLTVLFICLFLSILTFLVANKKTIIGKFAVKKREANLINPMYKIYKLENNRDLVFDLPAILKNARLVVRPIFTNEAREYPLNVNYSIKYEIIGDEVVIDARDYYMNTFLAEDKFELAKKRFKYDNGELIPYGAKVLFFNYRLGLSKAQVRVRLNSGDPRIKEYVARLQYSEEVDEREIDMKWERMPIKRKRLAEFSNLYRHELFSEREKFNLTHEKWKTVAPVGRPGIDFIQKNFIVDPNIDFFTYVEKFKPEYLLSSFVRIDPTHCMTITSLTEDHPVKFSFKINENSEVKATTLRMSWFGRKSYENKIESIDITGMESLEKNIKPGVVELCSDSVVLAEARQVFNNRIEVLSQASYKKLFRLDLNEPVRFKIFNTRKEPNPYKFSLYTATVKSEESIVASVKMKIFNRDKKLIKTVDLKTNSLRSKYNRVNNEEAQDISFAHDNVVYFPVESHFAEIYGDSNTFVKGYSRPYGLKTMDRIPEDYYKPLFDSERIPHWYPVAPHNYDSLFNFEREVSIRLQRKPPERKEYIVEHEYESQSFQPETGNLGKYVLAESENINKKLPASSYSFVRLPVNEALSWKFSNAKKEIKISPSVYIVTNKLPNKIQFFIDNKLVYSKVALHNKTTIVLPKIFTGDKEILLKTNKKSKAWINYSKVKSNLSFKKKIFSLKNRKAVFLVTKRNWDEMSLVGQLYLPPTTNGKIKLKGKIIRSSRGRSLAFTDWSLVERQWELSPTQKLYPLYNDLGVVQEGGSFSIPLHADLPPGEYFIELDLVDNYEAYITLAEIAKKGLIPVKKSIKLEMHE